MDATWSKRWKFINSDPPVCAILQQWPAYRLSSLVKPNINIILSVNFCICQKV